MIRIALDAMGGDFAPVETVYGAVRSLRKMPDVEILLVGREKAIREQLGQSAAPLDRIRIVNATEEIGMGEHAADAVRRKKDSSLSVATRLVADGKADAVVSAGNTGAAVAAATLFLRTLKGVKRPGIAVTLPSKTGNCLLMDAGANIYCKPEHLYQYALMASIFARQVMGKDHPKVGLLNVGSEEEKGTELVQEAHALCKKGPFRYAGFAEGRDIFRGEFDVVICEGFVGNVILKVSEGLAETLIGEVKSQVASNPLTLLGGLLVRPAFRKLKKKTDYAEYGGAPLLGIDGVCIISHGRSNSKAIRNAIKAARQWAVSGVNDKITEGLAELEKAS